MPNKKEKPELWQLEIVLLQWGKVNIDLSKPCPEELLEKNYSWQEYIPAEIVRWIIRELDYDVEERISTQTFMDSIVVSARVKITDDNGRSIEWVAQDTLVGNKAMKTMFPQTARIVALALKNALKYKFRFFEWEFTQDAEATDSISVEANSSETANTFAELLWMIADAKDEWDLNKFLEKQRSLKPGVINDDLLTKLRKEYKDKLASFK